MIRPLENGGAVRFRSDAFEASERAQPSKRLQGAAGCRTAILRIGRYFAALQRNASTAATPHPTGHL